MAEDRAVVLLSGGLDSTLCLSKASDHHEGLITLSLRYGQKHVKEVAAARMISRYYEATHFEVHLPDVFGGSDSTLIEGGPDNPQASYEEVNESQGVSPTYVPFRNGNLLSAATAIALREGASWLYYGAHAEDARNWAYPDCTPEFNGAMANAIYVGTYGKVRLVVPLQNMEKHDIAREMYERRAPIYLTWSCYEGREKHCGKCPTCIGRIRAFKNICVKDPVPYEIDINWKGCRIT